MKVGNGMPMSFRAGIVILSVVKNHNNIGTVIMKIPLFEGGSKADGVERKMQNIDEKYMRAALALARKAGEQGDVPVGAVIICGGKIIARARNEKEKRGDACAHAEMLCLNRAQKKLGRWRLSDCTLYVTKEPCAMCAGALVNCRVGRLVYGARDERFGCSGSLFDISGDGRLNHAAATCAGVLEADCAALLSEFFRARRDNA